MKKRSLRPDPPSPSLAPRQQASKVLMELSLRGRLWVADSTQVQRPQSKPR